MKAESLYVHFPFCEVKCHYCDFYSLAQHRTRPEDPEAFEKSLRLEMESKASLLAPQLKTIFLGGGTPSLTPPSSMARAFEPLWKSTQVTSETEWTMEANPASMNREAAQAYRKWGVNRVSLGVQALRDDFLKKLGRVHSSQAVFEALDQVFEAGFGNVSIDLLCGIPGQTVGDLEFALERLLKTFPLTHLSCYLLTLPPHHSLFSDLPSSEEQLAQLLWVHDWMVNHGFEHYEISNYSKPGKRALHNLQYWKGSSYLGLGPSAHSYDAEAQKRWKNVSSLHRYVHLLGASESIVESEEILSAEQSSIEKWMLAIRLEEGFPENWLALEKRKPLLKELEAKGWIRKKIPPPGLESENKETHWALTPRGWALSDELLKLFI